MTRKEPVQKLGNEVVDKKSERSENVGPKRNVIDNCNTSNIYGIDGNKLLLVLKPSGCVKIPRLVMIRTREKIINNLILQTDQMVPRYRAKRHLVRLSYTLLTSIMTKSSMLLMPAI